MAPSVSELGRSTYSEPGDPFEITEALRAAAKVSTGRQSYCRDAIRAFARHFDTPYAAIHIDLPSGSIEENVKHGSTADGQWRQICEEVLIDVRHRAHSIARLFEAGELRQKFAVMGVPIIDESVLGGSLVLVTRCESKDLAEAKLRELQALETQLSMMASAVERTHRPTSTSEASQALKTDPVIEGFARVGRFRSIKELAFSLANGMKSQLDCEQVSFAMVRKNQIELMCVSGCDEIKRRNPGIRLILDAMEECLDYGRPVLFHHSASGVEANETAHFLHKRWSQQAGGAVASIPFHLESECVAVVGIRQGDVKSMIEADLRPAKELVEPLLPAIRLLDRASRSPLRLLWWDVRQRLARAGRRRIAVVVSVVTAIVLSLAFGTLPYRITAPCRVVSAVERHIAAPFPGTILDATVRAGEPVESGQLLVQFDLRDLRNQAAKIEADIRVAELGLGAELTNRSSAKAAQQMKQIESLQSQLKLVRSRIGRAFITAPFDGVILRGDPRSRIGEVVALGEPLLTLGTQSSLRLEIDTPEEKAALVKSGQTGAFVTHTRPDVEHPFQIDSVRLAPTMVDGRSVYISEAKIQVRDRDDAFYCVGMSGFAKVETERKRVWWILTHKLLDLLSIQAWKL